MTSHHLDCQVIGPFTVGGGVYLELEPYPGLQEAFSCTGTGTDALGVTQQFGDRYFPSLGLEPTLGTCQKTSDHS